MGMVWCQEAYVLKHVPVANDLLRMTRSIVRTSISPQSIGPKHYSPDKPLLDHVRPDVSSNEQPSRISSHSPPYHR